MNKNVILATTTAITMFALSAVTLADTNLSYTYAELGYTDRDFNGPDADGFVLSGSFAITDMFFVDGSYTDLSGDFGFDPTVLRAGAGVVMAVNNMIDGYAKLSFVDFDSGLSDDTGLELEVGARALIIDQVEAFGNLQYIDIYNDTDTAIEVGGRYWHMSNLGFSASYTDGDYTGSGITLAARYNF